MSPAVLSLCALVAAIVISFSSRLNVGVVAIPLAWAAGIYAGQKPDGVLAGFPSSLFITLAGVTLLFSLSEVNGTVETLARRLLRAARGSARVVPILMFVIAGAIATLGPGAIASVVLVAPLAMALGERARIPPFLTALMVANGANAGNLSPLSAVGVIANTRMASVGLGGHEWKVWAANFLAHVLVAGAAYIFMWRRLGRAEAVDAVGVDAIAPNQWITIAIISVWIAAVVGAGAPIGLAAFAAAALIVILRAADDTGGVKRMPWAAIVMVCGMAMLVAAVEKAGGLNLFTTLLAKLATPHTINGVIAFVTGLISTASSTSGVVLPTFLPMAPGLVQQIGGGDPLAVALSINVGSSVVDVSPLSTLGAICVAAVADPAESRDLFRKLMIWGLSMSVVGALLCQLFAGPFAMLG
jgi:Na+/H+ antiporter NhaD/arsenite permease-like protein